MGRTHAIPNSYVVEAGRAEEQSLDQALKLKMAADTIANRGPTREAIFSNDPSAREQAKIPKKRKARTPVK